MKANELRIGNWVAHEPTIDDWEEIIVRPGTIIQCEISPDSFMPIPLTEEWCIKFGFQKDLENTIYKNINKHCFLCYDDNIVLLLEEENNWCITKVKYVHQLQNLYFALTKEELTLIK